MCEAKAIFSVKNTNTIILCKTDEIFKNIFQKLGIKINMDINKAYFLYNRNKINPESKYEEIINQKDKQNNCMNILGFEINITEIKEEKK